MCVCIEKMNQVLVPYNGRIASAMSISDDLSKVGSNILVKLEKIDSKKRKPLPNVAMSYCPFCGEKFADF